MNKIAFIVLSLFSLNLVAAPNTPGIIQRNAADSTTNNRFMPVPPSNALFFFNVSTLLPEMVTLGTGLSYSSGVLSSTGGGSQVNSDWNAVSGVAQILNKPTLATVGLTGDYADLINVPTSFASDWSLVTGKPTFSAVATSGAYSDLSGTPTIPAAQVNSDWNASSGVTQVLNKPSLSNVATSGAYNDLTGKPTQVSAFTNDSGYINSSALSPYLTIAAAGSTYATQSSVTAALSGKFNNPTGTTSQYIRGDGTLATLPASGTGTVTSITAGTGLTGGTISTSGTISLSSVGTAGTYSSVTTDAQGRVVSGTTQSINDNPGRTLVTSTSATGFQISPTRNAWACYEGYISTTSTIGGPSSAVVNLETADTNSTTPGDWTIKSQQTYANNITLAIVLNQQQANNWQICRMIPAGKYVRIRAGSIVGTASVTLNTTQQETLQ